MFSFLVEELRAFISDDLISSNLGKTLVLTWIIEKCEVCDIDLYFHSQHGGNIRIFHVTKYEVRVYDAAKKLFGDRINVTWVGRNYKVNLKHLQKNDTGNFSVLFYHLRNEGLGNISRYPNFISITDEKGMYRFLSEFVLCHGVLWYLCEYIYIATLETLLVKPQHAENIYRKNIYQLLGFLHKEFILFNHWPRF